jgi:hypothetical protein
MFPLAFKQLNGSDDVTAYAKDVQVYFLALPINVNSVLPFKVIKVVGKQSANKFDATQVKLIDLLLFPYF